MTDARDELVDVIAEALYDARGYAGCSKEDTAETRNVWKACQADAQATLTALVERYGEPEIERLRAGFGTTPPCDEPGCPCSTPDQRRLVFPWQPIEGETK